VLTFPESRCEYIHFLRVYVFPSPIHMKKKSYCGLLSYGIVSGTWVPTTWSNILVLSSGERYMIQQNFINLLLRVNTSPFSIQWTVYNNHTPHKRKSLSHESLTAAGMAQNMEPSFYPCKVYASCPWHMRLSLKVSTQCVSREVRLCC